MGELRSITRSGFREFPPRPPDQPIFYPVLTHEYARRIARDGNTVDAQSGFAGFVTKSKLNRRPAAIGFAVALGAPGVAKLTPTSEQGS